MTADPAGAAAPAAPAGAAVGPRGGSAKPVTADPAGAAGAADPADPTVTGLITGDVPAGTAVTAGPTFPTGSADPAGAAVGGGGRARRTVRDGNGGAAVPADPAVTAITVGLGDTTITAGPTRTAGGAGHRPGRPDTTSTPVTAVTGPDRRTTITAGPTITVTAAGERARPTGPTGAAVPRRRPAVTAVTAITAQGARTTGAAGADRHRDRTIGAVTAVPVTGAAAAAVTRGPAELPALPTITAVTGRIGATIAAITDPHPTGLTIRRRQRPAAGALRTITNQPATIPHQARINLVHPGIDRGIHLRPKRTRDPVLLPPLRQRTPHIRTRPRAVSAPVRPRRRTGIGNHTRRATGGPQRRIHTAQVRHHRIPPAGGGDIPQQGAHIRTQQGINTGQRVDDRLQNHLKLIGMRRRRHPPRTQPKRQHRTGTGTPTHHPTPTRLSPAQLTIPLTASVTRHGPPLCESPGSKIRCC